MTKKGKGRIIITLPEKMIKWIEETSKELGYTKSIFIKKLLKKNIQMIYKSFTQQELEEITRIARTKWIIDDPDLEDDDEY